MFEVELKKDGSIGREMISGGELKVKMVNVSESRGVEATMKVSVGGWLRMLWGWYVNKVELK